MVDKDVKNPFPVNPPNQSNVPNPHLLNPPKPATNPSPGQGHQQSVTTPVVPENPVLGGPGGAMSLDEKGITKGLKTEKEKEKERAERAVIWGSFVSTISRHDVKYKNMREQIMMIFKHAGADSQQQVKGVEELEAFFDVRF